MEIRIAKATYKVLTPARLPKLSTLMIRGVLGEKLKLLTCYYRTNILSRNCQICRYINNCPYGYLYEQGPDPLRINNALSAPPRPYVIEPLDKDLYNPDEELVINIKIATKANWVDKFIEKTLSSINQLGKDKNRDFGKIQIQKIEWFKKEIKPIKALQERVRIELLTPTAIYRDKTLLTLPSLYDFLVFSARRFFLIYSTFYDNKYQYKFHELVKIKDKEEVLLNKLKLEKIERWSNRRKRKELIVGLLGSITYGIQNIEEKTLRRDIRFLLGFANEMNVGKMAAAGLGKVNVTSYTP